jgi:PAS domain S-box-containing protein
MFPSNAVSVLHVDDDPDFADMAATFLERTDERLAVATASGASEALDHLAENDVDCVVSDYEMPGTDGIEFLEAVRDRYPDLPFVLYTGKGSEEIASEAISAGVTDYLQKEAGTGQYAVLANRITNAVRQYRSERELDENRERLSMFFEQSPLGVVEWDESFRFARLNDAAEEILGYTEAELSGEPWEVIVPESDLADVDEVVTALLDAEGGYKSVNENVTKGGDRIVCEWHNRVITDADGDVVTTFSQFQDVTERERRERVLEGLHDATRSLLRAETRRELADRIGEAADDVLGYSNNVVRLLSEDGNRLEPVALVSDDLPSDIDERPVYEVGEETAGVAFERGEPVIYDDVRKVKDDKERGDARTGAYLPIGEHGVLTITEFDVGVFDETDVRLASILATNAAIAFDRIDRRREQEARVETLTELNEGTARLFRADDPEEICEVVLETARDVLGYPNTVVRLVDEERNVLVPVAVTERAREELGERPEYPVGEGTAGRVFAAQEPMILDDAGEVDDGYRRKDGRAAIYLPIGEYGTISISDTTPGKFDDSDVELARLLAAMAEAAIYRIRQRETLERQNDRLDEFTSVISHDLRNPLSVATGRLELLGEDCDSEHLSAIETALERMETLTEELLTLAREGETATDRDPVDLGSIVDDCWTNVRTDEATLVNDVDRFVRADPSRLKQVFENLFRNSVEHGSTGGRTQPDDGADHAGSGGPVTVTVGELEDGFYIADDGPGVPQAERDEVFQAGYSTSEEGIGFGLSIVERIVDAHDWEVRVTEGSDGGARFEIRDVEFLDT